MAAVRSLTGGNGLLPAMLDRGRCCGTLPATCQSLVHVPRIAFLGAALRSRPSGRDPAALARDVEFADGRKPRGGLRRGARRKQSDFGLGTLGQLHGRPTCADTLEYARANLRVRDLSADRAASSPRTAGQSAAKRSSGGLRQARGISQCRNWLAKHLPAARSIEVTSTSTAAQLAGEKPGAAAIASLQAGIHYGLDVLTENIEDNPSNTTRFAVIGDQSPARTGNDRTAMLFQVEHRPGALADAMMVFKRGKLNLTWIESFPTPGPTHGYLFFVQMEGHPDRRAICAVPWQPWKRKPCDWKFSGSFPATAAGATDNIMKQGLGSTIDATTVDCRQLENEPESRLGRGPGRRGRTRRRRKSRRSIWPFVRRAAIWRPWARQSPVRGSPWAPEHVPRGRTGLLPAKSAPRCSVDLGCTYVILGHSERRHILGETDEADQ